MADVTGTEARARAREATELRADLQAGALVPTNVRIGQWCADNIDAIIAALESQVVPVEGAPGYVAPVRLNAEGCAAPGDSARLGQGAATLGGGAPRSAPDEQARAVAEAATLRQALQRIAQHLQEIARAALAAGEASR